jgi:hypothetical protein
MPVEARHPDYVFAHLRAEDSACIPVAEMYNTLIASRRTNEHEPHYPPRLFAAMLGVYGPCHQAHA